MAKQSYFAISIIGSLMLIFALFVGPVHGQTITMSPDQEDKLYELPHPGMLPDNPFYVVKNIRDQIMLWSTQDLHEKAQVKLLQSDKRMGSALELAKKGKHKMTVETLVEGEEMFMEVPIMLEQLVENGEKPRAQFLEEAIQSNARHRAAIEEVMLSLPQGDDAGAFRTAMQLNDEAEKRLEELAK